MALPPRFLDSLRDRVSISEVVGERVRLTRAGREFKGLCPFHGEKTPSFTVNDDKGFYHCFGCGAHGDIISFLMQHDRLEFREAVERLAERAGVPLPQETPEQRQREAQQRSLHDLAEAACRFFQQQLRGPDGRGARDYLLGRGLDEGALERFRLGYAPADRQALIRHLRGEGFEVEAMVELGLARRPEARPGEGPQPYAFFRDRVMFPVADRRGRVVAFGGRALDEDGPKYINSPDTPLFHKGELLYGLDRARTAARQGHMVVVAEGYMDVIALVRAGFEAAVAPLGTALTEAQAAELWRLSGAPVVCFDGDAAGQRAAWRAVERLLPRLGPDRSLRFAFLPASDDPDTLIARGGSAAMRQVLEAAKPLVDVVWETLMATQRTDTPEGRAGLRAALEAAAGRIEDKSVQSFYRKEFNTRLDAAFPWRPQRAGTPPGRGGSWGRQGGGGRGPAPAGPRPGRLPQRQDAAALSCILLAFVINHPVLFEEFGETVAMLPMPDAALEALKRAVVDGLTAAPDLDSDGVKRHLSEAGHASAVRRLLSGPLSAQVPAMRPETPVEAARDAWAVHLGALEAQRLGEELRQAAERLGQDMSAATFARVRALHPAAGPSDDGSE